MEEVMNQIEGYHWLSILCLVGMLLSGMISLFVYKRKNISKVLDYFRRNREKRSLTAVILWIVSFGCVFSMPVLATGGNEGIIEELPEDLPPVLERFMIGKEELEKEYISNYVQIAICIRDEQTNFDGDKVLLEYRIDNQDLWKPVTSENQVWNNKKENLFETVFEFSGTEDREEICEFRVSYIDSAGNALVLGESVTAETVSDAVGCYQGKKILVMDKLSPAYEVSYKDEQGKIMQFSEDGKEIVPYYNAAKEVTLDFKIQETYLNEEKTTAKITATDYNGILLSEEFLEMKDGEFKTTIKSDGHYYVEIYLVDLAGNETIHKKQFALDYTPPKQPTITYHTENTGILERFFQQLTFGYFSKEKITAQILVEDLVSVVKWVTYTCEDVNRKEVITKIHEDMEQKIQVELPFGFKGNLKVCSEDLQGNQSEIFTDIGVIAETEETHKKESGAKVKVQTKYSKTPNYYAGDVSLRFSVWDNYSGVREIRYIAGNTWDETINYREETEVLTEEISKEYSISVEDNQQNNVAMGFAFTDNAGHETVLTEKELPIIHIDTIAPRVDVVYDNYDAENGKYYRESRTVTISVTERNFDPADVDFKIVGPNPTISSWNHQAGVGCEANHDPAHTGHSDSCVWKCHVKFEEDGDYEFGFSCRDLAGNTGSYEKIDEFVIDQTIPVMRITYDNYDVRNEIFYCAPRIARIMITEKNFEPEDVEIHMTAENEGKMLAAPGISRWTSNGDNHQAVIIYDYDARFNFDIDYIDLAGNAAGDYGGDYFCVDLMKPEISIREVTDKSANNGIVSPLILVTDTNYGMGTTWFEMVGWENGQITPAKAITKIHNGEMIRIQDFEHIQDTDDLYCLTVEATDLAGNVSERRISFSVNRFGSVYTLDEATEKLAGKEGFYYTNEEKALTIIETNVDSLIFLEIICSLNGKLRTLKEGEDYLLYKSGDETTWKQYRYELKKENFTEEGHYIITIYSEDRAKNVSDNQSKGNRLSFAVDKTAPSILISGVENLGRYRENSRQLTVDVQDNLALSDTTVYLNGNPYVFDNMKTEESYGKLSVNIEGRNEWQTLRVISKDMAGNESITEEITFLVTPNIWVQFYHQKPLFYGGVGSIVLIAVIFSFYKFNRKRIKK